MTATINENVTATEKELFELITTANNPEKMVDFFISIMNPNSITYKIIMLMTDNYTSVAEFAKAVNMSDQAIFDIITGKTEPTLDEVIIIAKAINKEPEEIAQIFIDHHSK